MIKKSTPLKDVLSMASPCSCGSCNHGCRMGSGWLIDSDMLKIAKFLNISEDILRKEYLEPHMILNKRMYRPRLLRKEGLPYGPCIFFKGEKCSIHPVKPMECKIAMPCKDYGEQMTLWFMLNYILDEEDPKSVEEFESYLKSGGKTLPD